MPDPRLLLIGWDGADASLVDAMRARGDLPALDSIRTRGAAGKIEGLPGLGDDAAWSTFATGIGPGSHGRFHHAQVVPGAYRQAAFTRDDMTMPPFWDDLAAAGHPALVLDVPKAPRAAHPRVRELVDWMPHGEDGATPILHPPGFVLPARYLPDPSFDCHRVRTDPADLRAHASAILDRLQLRAALLEEWLGTQLWELAVAVFAEPHCAGHHSWSDSVPSLDDPVARIYRETDRALARLLDLAPLDTTVVVFSLIGMGPNLDPSGLLDPFLERLDQRPHVTPNRGLATAVAAYLPAPLKRGIARRMRGLESAVVARRFASRTAFALANDGVSGAIRLNVRGREPQGIVSPGADFEAACSRISAELLALRDADTGQPIVTGVVRVDSTYPGPHATAFADLLALWADGPPSRRVASPSLGEFELPPRPVRSGNHRTGGWYVAAGPHLAPSAPASLPITALTEAVRAVFGLDSSGSSLLHP